MQANTAGRARRRVYIAAAAAIIVIVLVTAVAAGSVFGKSPGAISTSSGLGSVSGTSTTSTGSGAVSTSSVSTLSTSSDSSVSSSESTTTSTGSTGSAGSSGDWITYHGGNSRDGSDASLPGVTSPSLGWKTAVDAPVYAEPLSYDGSVFAATENDTVYSISAATGAVQWSDHLGTPVDSSVPPYTCDGGDHPTLYPTIGITSTPVIDPSTGTIYVVALVSGTGYHLFALDTGSGQVRWTTPVGAPGLNSTDQEQRGALAMANGMVYIPFGGFSLVCTGIPHGWVLAYSLANNGTHYSYEVPSTGEADVWEPEGISVDSAGYLYIVTGDSTATTAQPFDYGVSVIKLSPKLAVVGYFSPSDYLTLDQNDMDLSTTGATLLPNNLVFSIGKEGVGYLLNSSDLGGVGGQLASLQVCPTGGAWGATAYFAGVVYVPCSDGLDAVAVNGGSHPGLTSLWNVTGFFAGPPIIAAGAVWTFDIFNGTLFALNPQTGAVIAKVSDLPENSLAHFATPSVGYGLILFAGNDTVYGLDP